MSNFYSLMLSVLSSGSDKNASGEQQIPGEPPSRAVPADATAVDPGVPGRIAFKTGSFEPTAEELRFQDLLSLGFDRDESDPKLPGKGMQHIGVRLFPPDIRVSDVEVKGVRDYAGAYGSARAVRDKMRGMLGGYVTGKVFPRRDFYLIGDQDVRTDGMSHYVPVRTGSVPAPSVMAHEFSHLIDNWSRGELRGGRQMTPQLAAAADSVSGDQEKRADYMGMALLDMMGMAGGLQVPTKEGERGVDAAKSFWRQYLGEAVLEKNTGLRDLLKLVSSE